ncbi:hypothetical protein [Floccifex sp.]|uniref:hypothetical protein n=1 Tax=Floccifex sp. TaxID=2815810 RepID=UPI003F062BA8|nr:zinc ribbon domain-containing protein [Erysipelotrichaceae bacterium]
MNIKTIECPSCGANLEIDENRKELYCAYCGNKIIVQNENEHIIHEVNEADVKKAEYDYQVKLKQLEMDKQNQKRYNSILKLKIVISMILGIIGFISFLFGEHGMMIGMMAFIVIMYIWLFHDSDKKPEPSYGIRIPSEAYNYEKKNYITVELLLRNKGFSNITCIPLHDLSYGLIIKPGMIESITIDGESLSSSKKYDSEAKIVITYHSLK